MHPAYSVILLTTLIGVGQGLFLALYTGQVYSLANLLPAQDSLRFYAIGSILSLALLAGGLLASFFHLGHPERAWRAASQWRTSWLSREVIVLPAFMSLVLLYALTHYFHLTLPLFTVADTLAVDATLIIGLVASVLAFVLFLCTAMIYASMRFIKAWHSPLTVANFVLLGIASGFMLAAAFSAYLGAHLVAFYATWAVLGTLLAALTRAASLYRNSQFKCKVDLQSAIGVHHSQLQQKSQGFMGGSFNTREFFHGAGNRTLASIKGFFLVTVFVLPVALLAASNALQSAYLPILAFAVQYLGLMAERWYFFAEARHPQNLYYQTVG